MLENKQDKLDYYVGLDQALLNTGIAMCQPHNKELVVRTLVTDSQCSSYERLFEIEREIDWVTSIQSPNHVWLERAFTNFQSARRKTALALMAVDTTICNLLYRKNIPFTHLDSQPRVKKGWPRTLEIAGAKDPMQQYLRLMGYKTKFNSHEADAIGIVWAGLIQNGIILHSDLDSFKIIKAEKVCRPLSASAG